MSAHQQSSFGDAGPSSYPHAESVTPHHSSNAVPGYDAQMSTYMVSPEMSAHMPLVSPSGHHPAPQHMMSGPQVHDMMQYQRMPPSHHTQPHPVPRQTYAGVNYMPMQRQPSIQSTRSESPHMMGADVFGGPVNPPMPDSSMSIDHSHAHSSAHSHGHPQSHLSVGYEYGNVQESYTSDVPLGISPARALGPAPVTLQPMATPGSSDSHMTPRNNAAPYHRALLSSSSAESSSGNSSSVDRPRTAKMTEASDDENESPTKRVRDRIPTFEQAESRSNPPAKRPNALATRPKAGPSGAGRSSAKLTKVAEDPGVEGIPPGPRSTERPSQSFACIIGQAILKSSAGGLSLEHIYRYVETAYPYFKTVDQWRNSVRHNLSIHKIFVTAPRTEKHPPGKGGIWIIEEAEKIHWPSEDKFIKNFQPSHPHHAVCRQTLHERAQEKKLREKAEAEGRPYIPKKGKRSKLIKQADELKKSEPLVYPPAQTMQAPPLPPNMHQHPPMPPQVPMAMGLPPVPQQPPIRGPPHMHSGPPQPLSPPPHSGNHNEFEFEDDSDFVPDNSKRRGSMPPIPPLLFPEPLQEKRKGLGPSPSMAPPRSFPGQENKPIHDDDGVFSAVGPTKRGRPSDPLSPVLEQQPDPNSYLDGDMFSTPARVPPNQPFASVSDSSRQLTSSALKTPALIQTSSSPTSSPMPPTVTRSSHHHPSGLQQAWTQDDMIHSNGPSSPAKLEAAFDLKPAPIKRDRDDDFNSLAPHAVERAPPKTPVTRSSAAAALDRTPRVGSLRTPNLKTPLTYGSPARLNQPPGTIMSTPMWEMNGVLDRLNCHTSDSPTRTPRSDVPPTSPTHYSLSDCGDSPIAKRRKVATS